MLTPSEIEAKTFRTSLKGYDLDEVDDFLDEVVATVRELTEKVEARSTATPPPPAGPPADETAVGRALVAAQTAADQIVAEAREEAERILSDAQAGSEEWIAQRDAKKAAAETEMAELSRHVATVRAQLAALSVAVADKLDEMDEAIAGLPGESTQESEAEVFDPDSRSESAESTWGSGSGQAD